MSGVEPADLLAANQGWVPPAEGERPAAPGSPMLSLRARRDAARQKLHTDLAVPRYDPPVYVRFRPLSQGEIDAAQKTHEKSKDRDRTVIANAGLLANACLGIYVIDEDGQEIGVGCTDPGADWPRFDKDFSEQVSDVPLTRASDIVRALYFTDGDVIATAARLTEWSGYNTEQLERADRGN